MSQVNSERERFVMLIRRIAREEALEVVDEAADKHLDDFEHKEKLPEDFDPAKFVITPFIGAIARIMAARYGYTFNKQSRGLLQAVSCSGLNTQANQSSGNSGNSAETAPQNIF
jgi:hypothetical protein